MFLKPAFGVVQTHESLSIGDLVDLQCCDKGFVDIKCAQEIFESRFSRSGAEAFCSSVNVSVLLKKAIPSDNACNKDSTTMAGEGANVLSSGICVWVWWHNGKTAVSVGVLLNSDQYCPCHLNKQD